MNCSSSSALRLAVRGPAPGSREPGSAPGACFADPRSPWSPALAPPAPPPVARLCSSASSLLCRSQISLGRASAATAPHLPATDHPTPNRAYGRSRDLPVPAQGASVHARVSDHAGSDGARNNAPADFAFRQVNNVSTRIDNDFAAQWLAYTLPYRCFADVLADACARIGGDVDCYSFTAVDFHHILLASLPAHSLALRPARSADLQRGRFSECFRPFVAS